MPAEIQAIESALVALAQAVPYLATSVIAGADPRMMLSFGSPDIIAPAVVVVFQGERVSDGNGPGGVQAYGGSTAQSVMEWSLYAISTSFATDGEGRLGDQGCYQMVDDLIAAIDGRLVSADPDAKAFYVGCRRYDLNDSRIVYEISFRNQFIRQGV